MEILKEGASAWVLSAISMSNHAFIWGTSAVNIGNKILVMGKYFNPHVLPHIKLLSGGFNGYIEIPDVHEFDPSTETFVKVGQMKQGRRWFAVSVASSKDVIQHCL